MASEKVATFNTKSSSPFTQDFVQNPCNPNCRTTNRPRSSISSEGSRALNCEYVRDNDRCRPRSRRRPGAAQCSPELHKPHGCLSSLAPVHRELYRSPEAANVKGRILATVFVSATALVFCGTQIPMPMSVNGIGIVQRSEDQTIRADASGFLGCSLVLAGDRVYPGQPMCELINPDLNLDVLRKEAEVQQLEIQLLNLISTDRPTALLYQEKLEQTQKEYQQICSKQNRLRVEVNADGVITGTDGLQFPGQFIKEGDVLATLSGGRWIVQTLITAEDLYAATPQVGTEVEVCSIGYPDNTCAGRVIRVARAGSRVIQDASLAYSGGGSIPVNVNTMEASQAFFEVAIAIPNASQPSLRHGMTAMVRFHRQPVSIATILYRRSLLLLSKLQKAG